jgi:hypothetical protein
MSMPDRAYRLLVLFLLLLLSLMLTACTAAEAAPVPPDKTEPAGVAPVERQASASAGSAGLPTAVPLRVAQAVTPEPAAPEPEPVPEAPPPGPTAWPTPTPRAAGTPPRVGLQVGHLNSHELPDELAHLRTSTGARWGNVSEAQLNYEIVSRVKPLLEAQGVIVDVLPATVPPGYEADAFLAIHADGSRSAAPRGWKLATPWRASAASKLLLERVGAAYGPASGLPHDAGGVTVNMRGYYAFNWRRHTHAVAATTPAIIVELGFMTNAADRAVLFGQPDRIARGLADGILDYLARLDPNDGAARIPPVYPVMHPLEDGVAVRSGPRANASVVGRIGPEARFTPFDKLDGWYQGFARVGERRLIGWVREDQLRSTDEQPVFPTATNP